MIDESIQKIERTLRMNPADDLCTITDGQLEKLKNLGQNIYKDLFFLCLGLFIPTLINGLINIPNPFTLSTANALELFLNFLVAGICFILGIVFSIGWYITHREKSELITKIENQPRFVAQLTRTEGSTESGTVAPSTISDI